MSKKVRNIWGCTIGLLKNIQGVEYKLTKENGMWHVITSIIIRGREFYSYKYSDTPLKACTRSRKALKKIISDSIPVSAQKLNRYYDGFYEMEDITELLLLLEDYYKSDLYHQDIANLSKQHGELV